MVSKNRDEILVRFKRKDCAEMKCYLRVGSSDPAPYEQVFIQGEYQPVIDLIKKNQDFNHIRYIVDAGGNIGLSTLYFRQYFPSAEIIIIEPDDRNFDQIQKNIAINGYQHVTPVKAGLWTTTDYLSITQPAGLMNQTSLVVEKSDTPTTLKGTSLSDLMANHRLPAIDLLKIDIEGAEKVLFDDPGFKKLLLEKVKYLAIEIHDKKNVSPSIYDFLNENHFSVEERSETTFAVNRN